MDDLLLLHYLWRMKVTPKALGFRRREFAARVGLGQAAVSDNTNGRPGKVNPLWEPLMDALDRLSQDQRAAWLAASIKADGP